MDDLLADFLAETREMLAAIGGELVAWEAEPADRARLDAIFRFVHTVKGNCGFFDFPRLEALSHAAEDALADVRAGRRAAGPRLVTAVLAVIDRISAMTDAIEAGEELPATGEDALIAALQLDGAELDEVAPAADPANLRANAPAASTQRTIRLQIGLMDSVMSCVSDLVLARNDLSRRMRDADIDPGVMGPFERLSTILDQVRESVTRMRMQRIEHLFGALPRMVRDLSAELGKQVMIDLEGGEVELDREMVETIRDPLTHIIRNAIDHGIEPPHERLALGKREIGTLTVSARQSGNRIMLAVSDDGRGIDAARLTEKAVAAGAVSAEDAATLDDDERIALIFEPGLSTASAVTAVSGRGVGMDVVRANIERIGGTIKVTSTPGEGTRILLGLPLTLSIIPSLTVGAGGQLFAVPRSYVEEIVRGRAADLEFAQAGDGTLVTVRGQRVPCISLGRQLGLGPAHHPQDSTLLLVRLAGGDVFAIAVDRVYDHEELVIKPLAPAIMATGLYAGTTLLDDGHPVLMLDVAGIAKAAGALAPMQKRAPAREVHAARSQRSGPPALLFTGLDGARRIIRLGAIRRIERIAAAAFDLAADPPRVVIGDQLLPLAGADGAAALPGSVNVLRLGDGQSEIAYAIDRIVDTIALEGEIAAARVPGAAEGSALVAGVPAEVVDTHWLFATHAAPPRAIDPPRCRLPVSDPWVRTILAPLVESAGYRVLGEDDEGTADVAIATDDTPPAPASAADTVITLCADPTRAGAAPGVLYRYDRAGLLAALAALRSAKAA